MSDYLKDFLEAAKKVEDSFAKNLTDVVRASKKQDMYEHWDMVGKLDGESFRFEVKGKEFDNVVFDFTLTRQEESFSKKRMKFVACSRAKKTLWLIKSRNNLTFAGKEDL